MPTIKELRVELTYQLGQIGRVNVADILRRSTAKFPNRTAVADPLRSVTYAQLNVDVNRVAHGLLNIGLSHQAFVAIMSGRRVETIQTYFACARAGLVAMPLDPGLGRKEFDHIFRETTPKVVVVSSEALEPLLEILKECASLEVVFVVGDPSEINIDDPGNLVFAPFSELVSDDETDVEVSTNEREAVQCLYTSGTTAMPKGVLTSHLAVTFSSLSVAYDIRLTERDITLTPLPLNHVAALNTICTTHLMAGAAVHFMHSWDVDIAAAEIERLGVTDMVLTGPLWTELTKRAKETATDISSLRCCIVGMASLLPERAEQLRALAPRADIFLASGMTEFTSWQSFVRSEDQQTKALAWGSPGFMNEVAIMNESGDLLGPNVTGEIVYRGPTAMNGYLGQEEATAKQCSNGWFRTGDVGYLDEEHVLWFVDRLKDMIKTGGENVASLEVSDALFGHPDVADCAIVGLPHERWSEAITAFVKLRDGSTVTADALVDHCRDRLARFKVPKRVLLVDEFPRTSSGKIKKAELREQYADLYDHDAASI